MSELHGCVPAASTLLRQRDIRERLFPRLGDPAWTMLLILCSDRRPRHVSNLCHGSHAPYTTALRHLDSLERKGLIERKDDPKDERAVNVSLTILACEKFEGFADRLKRLAA